jgi:uncharacterized MAPEG superfamily protein
MMTDVTILVCSAVLTFLMLGRASAFRTQALAPGGMARATGNRDNLLEPTPMAGRADRAARNMVENLLLFTALIAALHFAGKSTSSLTQIGANIFFWARVAYWPIYVAGWSLRSLVWTVSIVGLGMIAWAALT